MSTTTSNQFDSRITTVAEARFRLEELNLNSFYRLRLAALLVATLVIVLGAGMVFLGLKGSINLNVQVAAVNTRLVNASPGIVFATLGMILCFVLLAQQPYYAPLAPELE